MNSAVRPIASLAFLLSASLAIRAERPYTLTQLNCTGPTYNAGVYAYDLSLQGNPRLFTVYLSQSRFLDMNFSYFTGTQYQSCMLANLPTTTLTSVSVVEVDAVGAGIDVGAGEVAKDTTAQSYTQVIFRFNGSSLTNAKIVSPQATLSPEQEARAIELYKARTANLMRR